MATEPEMPTLHYCIRHTKVTDEILDNEYDGGHVTLTDDEVEQFFKKKASGNFRQVFDESIERLAYCFRNYDDLDEEALQDVQLCVGTVLYALYNGVAGENFTAQDIVVMDQVDIGGEVDIYEMPAES
ncbi:MAG: hypothetical protein OQK24_06070 [Magnetovibrio sp.]|nr:hypothetical protein [Magnetovibrio sp.]